MQFVPLWTSILKSRKIGTLSPEAFRFWILCLVSAQDHDHKDGTLPRVDDLAYSLHMNVADATRLIKELVACDLICDSDACYSIHDWKDWKHNPDPTNAERQRRFREKRKMPKTPKQSENENPVTTVTVTESANEETIQVSGVSPMPDPAKTDPEVDRLANLAASMAGDVSWSLWVTNSVRMGHPCHAIVQALEVCKNMSKWDKRLAAGVLRRLYSEGYPKHENPERSTNGKPQNHPVPNYIPMAERVPKSEGPPLTPEQVQEFRDQLGIPSEVRAKTSPGRRKFKAANPAKLREAVDAIARRATKEENP